jgi:hypothetical protein
MKTRLKQIVGSAISSNSVISFGKHLANEYLTIIQIG